MAEKIFPELGHTDDMFLSELSSDIERLMNQHNASPRFFVPAEIDDEILQAIKDDRYNPSDEDIAPEVMDALIVNLLTEDGLPYYTSALEHKAPPSHPFRAWVHQWTGEEGRHSPAISAFVHRSGKINMRWLEKARLATMSSPDTPQPASLIEGIIYPAIQEPATEVSHRNTTSRLPEGHRKFGRKAIGPVVGDEVKHGIFYGDLSEAALRVDPSSTVIAIARQVIGFAMPGKAIPDFDERKKAIESAGIFGVKQLSDIYKNLFAKRWPLASLEGLTHDAERARDLIVKKMGQMTNLLARREEAKAKASV